MAVRTVGKLVYAIFAYALFLLSILWSIAFLANLGGLGTVDHGGNPAAPPAQALAVDLALLALFAVQHSVMARPAFKRAWTQIVPTSIERATYVWRRPWCCSRCSRSGSPSRRSSGMWSPL
jgi:hypothetical protein